MSWKREQTLVKDALSVHFLGPAVEQHQMDLKDLAESLVGIETAYRQVYSAVFGPEKPAPRLGLADVSPGSFIYDVTVMQDINGIADVAKTIFNSPEITAVLNAEAAAQLLGGLVGSIWVVRDKARSKQAVPVDHPDQTEGSNKEQEIVDKLDEILVLLAKDRPGFNTQAARHRLDDLTSSERFIKATEQALSPLGKSGYESIEIQGPGATADPVVVTRSDYENLYLAAEDEQNQVETMVSTAVLKFESLKFTPGTKTYTFTAGGVPLRAKIMDEVFRERLINGLQRIGANDTIQVKLHTTTTRFPDGSMKFAHEILQVLGVNVYTPPEHDDALPLELP